MKIVFDTSIHLGQFDINDEATRIAAKNSQASISRRPDAEVVGAVSFNENSYCDNTIWSLPREVQDVFYLYMDIYHSSRNINRVPMTVPDVDLARALHAELDLHISNSLTCAIAINQRVQELHSLYSDFSREPVRALLLRHGVRVWTPGPQAENLYAETTLEAYYQDALRMFRDSSTVLSGYFHT
ncbi:MAG TPA: DUF6190 family protein [Pyrinomonadaceae bacterium]